MSMKLHAVILNKNDYTLSQAKEKASHFIPPSRKYYRQTENSYRFRNISEQKFEPGSFRGKKVNNNVTLIFGKLKSK